MLLSDGWLCLTIFLKFRVYNKEICYGVVVDGSPSNPMQKWTRSVGSEGELPHKHIRHPICPDQYRKLSSGGCDNDWKVLVDLIE